ncbi:hypothetical protein [Candidatus Enterovibrio escicola]|nr:hypothetical protein [Candidatus Enterovibrio escacola]
MICLELRTMPHVTEKMLCHELIGVLSVYNKPYWLKAQKESYDQFDDALFAQVQTELEYEKTQARVYFVL